MNEHPRALLSAYLDGELGGDEAARVERHLRNCTECARELSLITRIGGAMRAMPRPEDARSVWSGVHRRITRPLGWILLLVGLALWAGLALVAWARAELTLEWLALTGIGVGLLLLVIGIGYEQYRDWTATRYRDVER